MTRRDVARRGKPGTPIRRAQSSVRHRSEQTLFGLPLIDIASGPDPERGEKHGRARGIIAIGDEARGWLWEKKRAA
ncbi:MAG TPA: hypothetical protein VIX19_05530 [Terriglobales bacterium]